jgi:hypothetical protein
LYLGFAEISMLCIFLSSCPPKSTPKNQEAREANFAKYFTPKPPAFRKISLAFRISALRLLCPQNIVAECRAFSRTSASAEAPRFAWWRFSARGTLVDILTNF